MVTRELISWLRETIKNRCPKPTETDREIWINVGKNMVVEMLERKLAEVEELGILTNSVFKSPLKE